MYGNIHGKLNLVDLAGSERVKKSLVVKDRLAEACAINKCVLLRSGCERSHAP